MRAFPGLSIVSVVGGCIAWFFVSHSLAADMSQSELRAYTEWAVRTGHARVSQPTFDWSGNYMQYKLPCVDDSFGLSDTDPLAIPLRDQFTVLAIRKYRSDTEAQRSFWRPILKQAEQHIEEMLALIKAKNLRDDELLSALDEKSGKITDMYQAELDELARSKGKRGARTVSTCQRFSVDLKTDPVGGAIAYMTAGQWSLYIFMTDVRKVRDFPVPEWQAIEQCEGVPLTGKNWFSVTWPNGGRYKKLVNITSAEPITFRPQ